MKFMFVCPEKHREFETDEFELIDNQGVITDNTGNRTLDAKVALAQPCPFCGKKHIFHASELACPFNR